MKLHFFSSQKALVFWGCILSLTACGGDSSESAASADRDNNHAEVRDIVVTAEQTQDKAIVGQTRNITVLASAEDDRALEIKSLTQTNNNTSCEVTEQSELTFSVSSDTIGECRYTYTVGPVASTYSGTAQAMSRVAFSSTAAEESLPIVSAIAFVDFPTTVNVKTLLGADWPGDTFTLSDLAVQGEASVTQNGTDGNALDVLSSTDGVTRVVFTLSDGVDTRLGTLDIAVSKLYNTRPIVADYDYAQITGSATLAKDTQVLIDLSTLASDADSDVVTLDQVWAINGTVSNMDTANLTFNFSSSVPGVNQIAYSVTDGHGGYDTGVATILIESAVGDVQPWQSIVMTDATIGADLTFTGPQTQLLADEMATSYTDTAEDLVTNKTFTVSRFTYAQAQAYCTRRHGRLPMPRELALLASKGNLTVTDSWPTSNEYWTGDKISATTGTTYNLSTGIAGSQATTSAMYTTCVLLDSAAVKNYALDLDYTPNATAPLEVIFTGTVFDPDGNPAPYQSVVLQAQNSKGIFSNQASSVTADADGNGVFTTSYYDNSFNAEVMTAGFVAGNGYEVLASRAYSPGDETKVDVFNESAWSRQAYYGSTLPAISGTAGNGLPIWESMTGTQQSVNIYQHDYTGNNFLGRLSVFQYGSNGTNEPTVGRFVFSVQQVAKTVSGADFTGATNSPGVPSGTDATVSIVYDYRDEMVRVYQGGDNLITGLSLSGVRAQEAYLWFSFVQNKLTIYVSATKDRPESPTLALDLTWGGIDPNGIYWLEISSFIQASDTISLNEASAKSIRFGSWAM